MRLLVKADVRGSVEALCDALARLGREEVEVDIVSSGVGGITESDINLAATSEASVIGFNVRLDPGGQQARKATGVEVRYYSVIYEVLDDVQEVIKGRLAPVMRESIVGNPKSGKCSIRRSSGTLPAVWLPTAWSSATIPYAFCGMPW